MFKLLCVALLIASANCIKITKDPKSRTEIKNAPYIAQLINIVRNEPFCGASIISPQWLVSAAHCFDGWRRMPLVRTGSTLAKRGETHRINKVIQHPDWDANYTKRNDICLIKLNDTLKFNENQTRIALDSSSPNPGDWLTISGYGTTGLEIVDFAPWLKLTHIQVVERDICRDEYIKYGRSVPLGDICAGNGEHNACPGDSGGPALSAVGKLVALISGGFHCYNNSIPTCHHKINLHLDWIARTTGLPLEHLTLDTADLMRLYPESPLLSQTH